jgi:hypothetical protein
MWAAASRSRKNGWTIAEHAGDATPDRTQRLLNRAVWDHDRARGITEMIADATMPPWAAGDEVYGRCREPRTFLQDNCARSRKTTASGMCRGSAARSGIEVAPTCGYARTRSWPGTWPR